MKGKYNHSLIKEEARQQIEEGLDEWNGGQETLRQARKILSDYTEEINEAGEQLVNMAVFYPWELAVLNFYFGEIESFFK